MMLGMVFFEFEPDVVFLDIVCPVVRLTEVARKIGRQAICGVYHGICDQYAADAFNSGAVDYLLACRRRSPAISTLNAYDGNCVRIAERLLVRCSLKQA